MKAHHCHDRCGQEYNGMLEGFRAINSTDNSYTDGEWCNAEMKIIILE